MLQKLGGHEKVHRGASPKDEEKEITNLGPPAGLPQEIEKLLRGNPLRRDVEAVDRLHQEGRHHQKEVTVVPEAPPLAERRIGPHAPITSKENAHEVTLVTFGTSHAASMTAPALAALVADVISCMVPTKLQPLLRQEEILLRILADPTGATVLTKGRNRKLRLSQRLPSLLSLSQRVQRFYCKQCACLLQRSPQALLPYRSMHWGNPLLLHLKQMKLAAT